MSFFGGGRNDPNNIRKSCGFIYRGVGCMRPMNHAGVCHNPRLGNQPPMYYCYECDSVVCVHVQAAQTSEVS